MSFEHFSKFNAPTVSEVYLKMLKVPLIMQKIDPHEKIFSRVF